MFDLSITTGLTSGKNHRLREDSIVIVSHPSFLQVGIIEGKASEKTIEMQGCFYPVGYVATQLAHNIILKAGPQTYPEDILNDVEEYLQENGVKYANDPGIFATDIVLLQYDDRDASIQFASIGRCALIGKTADGSSELMSMPEEVRLNEKGWKEKIRGWHIPPGGFPNHSFTEIALLSDGFFSSDFPSDYELKKIGNVLFDNGHQGLVDFSRKTNERLADDASSIHLKLDRLLA